MNFVFEIVILVIILIVIWYIYHLPEESFSSCDVCEQKFDIKKNAVINPFVWPYSGGWNPDNNNAQEYLSRLQNRTVPDHVPKTN